MFFAGFDLLFSILQKNICCPFAGRDSLRRGTADVFPFLRCSQIHSAMGMVW